MTSNKETKMRLGILVLICSIALLVTSAVPGYAGSKYIGKKTAIRVATKDASVSTKSKKYKLLEAEREMDDGVMVWEIEFKYASTKYEYEIDAITKEIREKDVEIGKKKVKKIARKKAKVKESSVRSWDIDHHDSKNYYSVVMKTKSHKYTMRVHSESGKVSKYKKTRISKPSSQYIGVDKAKKIALNHAKSKVEVGGVTFTKAKLEKDDGVMVYEIEFYSGSLEFEYEIHAKSGKILEWDIDRD